MQKEHNPMNILRSVGLPGMLVLSLILLACGPAGPSSEGSSDGQARTLTIFAASSLTTVFTDIGKQFELQHPGVRVEFNFNASSQLRGQLEHGARADIFASANIKEMDAAIKASTVVSGTQRVFARNRLIMVFPKDNPGNIRSLMDLARPNLKLIIADAPVPVGQYTLDMLHKMSSDPAFGADFADRVLANVVSREATVEAVAKKTELGEADAAIVYMTNVAGAAADKLGWISIPDEYNQIATYPLAPVVNALEPDLAHQWIEFVISADGQEVLTTYGFIPIQMAQP